MIDNLQVHYLEQLQKALQYALHGQVATAVDVCFELRLKPDLGLYPRAVVNMTLANLTTFQSHPDKIKFARESLRLAQELKVCVLRVLSIAFAMLWQYFCVRQ